MPQCGENCIEAIGQCCGSWLQYQRRFDLDNSLVLHRRDRIPAGSSPDLIRNDLLAAPRGENDVGHGSNYVPWRNNTVFGSLLFSQLGKHLLASGDLDEFRDPANSANERIVPFLEINLGLRPAANRCRHLAKASFIALCKRFSLVQRSDQSADGADHCENAGDVALVESMDGNAGADELCCDFRLEIGECEDKIRLERK